MLCYIPFQSKVSTVQLCFLSLIISAHFNESFWSNIWSKPMSGCCPLIFNSLWTYYNYVISIIQLCPFRILFCFCLFIPWLSITFLFYSWRIFTSIEVLAQIKEEKFKEFGCRQILSPLNWGDLSPECQYSRKSTFTSANSVKFLHCCEIVMRGLQLTCHALVAFHTSFILWFYWEQMGCNIKLKRGDMGRLRSFDVCTLASRVQQLLWFSMHLNGLLLFIAIVLSDFIWSHRLNENEHLIWFISTMDQRCLESLFAWALEHWCVGVLKCKQHPILLIKMLYSVWPCDNAKWIGKWKQHNLFICECICQRYFIRTWSFIRVFS